MTILVADHHNTGQLAIDGNVVTKRRSTPFGEDLQASAPAWPNDHGYLDKTKDLSTGTTHLGAREYDPSLGRFLSVDPVLDTDDPQQMNGYAYANNAPVTSADPTGLYVPCEGSCKGGKIYTKDGSNSTNGPVVTALSRKASAARQAEEQRLVYRMMNPTSTAYNDLRVQLDTFGVSTPSYEELKFGDGKDFLHILLGGCGMVPVVGEPCDGADAAVYASDGDWGNAAISGGSTVPLWGWLPSGARWGNRGKNAAKASDNVADVCRPNSFSGDTAVLMADGTHKPIKDVRLGDEVAAGDPATGKREPRKVIDLIRHGGLHTMVALRLADGTTVNATDHHPFWVANRNEWVDAGNLTAGDEVMGADSGRITIISVGIRVENLRAYNLSVAGLHTYYAGSGSVLVHNSGCLGPADSPVWGGLDTFKGKVRSNGLNGKKREYSTWDYTHNDIEVYNSRGVHLGSRDPISGEMYKPPVKGRTLER